MAKVIKTKKVVEKTKKRKIKVLKEECVPEVYVSDSKLPVELEEEKREKASRVKLFRIRSKRFFLTYPRLPKMQGLEAVFIESLRHSFNVIGDSSWKYLIAVEEHLDGTPHVHVYLEFNMAQGVYTRDKLSVTIPGAGEGGSDKVCEGKYEAVKNQHHVIQYILKTVNNADDVVTNMVLPIISGIYYSDPAEHLHAVVSKIGYEEGAKTLMEMYPKLALTKGSAVLHNMELASNYFINKAHKKAVRVYNLSELSNLPSGIMTWLKTDSLERNTLVLHGPPGTGKTELAKSILYHLGCRFIIIRELNALKGLSLSAIVGVIFDDLDTDKLSREELIHIMDTGNDSQIRILYGIAVIPAGTPRIFTTNRLGRLSLSGDAVNRRMLVVEIDKPLWISTKPEATATLGATHTGTNSKGTSQLLSGRGTDVVPDKESLINNQSVSEVLAEKPAIKPKRGRPKKNS